MPTLDRGREPTPTPTATPPDPAPPERQVALVHWPLDEATRRLLEAAGQPRLLLVAPHEPPPVNVDELEDWVRMPIDPEELETRRRALARRPVPPPATVVPEVTLDGDGVLRREGRWVALSPTEVRAVTLLLGRRGQVVPRPGLSDAIWPDAVPSGERALDTVVKRLRRRVAPLGVGVHTVTGRGYLLDVDPAWEGG